MKRILIIPSDHGGGRGHVSRCLYLAGLLRSFGKESAIVLEPKHYSSGTGSDYKTFLLDTRKDRFVKYQFKKPFKPGIKLKSKVYKRPAFVEFNSLSYQVPRDGYWTPKLVNFRFEQLSKIIEQFKPDLLVGDTHFLTFLAGEKFKIPVIQITRLAGYPPQPEFFWWKENSANFKQPLALGPFMPLLNELHLSDIQKAEDLLKGNKYLIPAIPEVEPIKGSDESVTFCGPLAEVKTHNQNIPFFNEESTFPKIYVSIGGGAGRSQERKFFDAILAIFDMQEYSVLVSTGNRIKADKLNGKSVNVHFENWVHGPSAIEQSDLVIYHGGYGTTMEVLANMKPSIVMPSHSEQEGNGRRLESLEIGKTVHFCNDRQDLNFEWPFGEYNMRAGFDFDLDGKQLLDETKKLIYGDSIEKLKSLSANLIKAKEDFNIEKLLGL
ncbi:MAG: hypothetical protein D8M58_13030 [Calditrichaeota bacterium]|nr:MAG: hypothetical protein DWQ03_13815 [Calditrichota bacterium]MBL1206323.1 hypothetical protein [Calditrichota bacterium]NOG46149.1 hypothetical protein [Calditrichota bacterium]